MSHLLFEVDDDLLEGEGPLEQELNGIVKGEMEHLAESDKLEHEGRIGEARALRNVNHNSELYMSIEGRVSLVNVLPDGRIAPGATFGGLAESGPEFGHDISADGTRVFWSQGVVYMRENGASTEQVSAGPATFWTASTDGRYAFYVEAGQLWRFDTESDTRVQLAGAAGGVTGVIATNETGEDGAYVYFVSTEALAGVENTAKQQPVEGEHNLYVLEPDPDHAGQSRIAFVGNLNPEDSTDWAAGLGARSASLTPDGHTLVFISRNNLTGAPYPGEGSEEIYVYSAGDAGLFCASCTPQASGGHFQQNNVGPPNLVYGYRRVSEDGSRVFFDSTAPLVAQDVNGLQDVYEWERDGAGGCSEPAGCVYLLSSGDREGSAFLLDASASGNDVFIVTRQRLTPEDLNEDADLYDARVDGVRPVSSPACTGTGCQGVPPAAPVFATPASVTFNGVGNFPAPANALPKAPAKSLTRAQKLARALAACHREHPRGKRSACERKAHRLYGSSAKKTADRRAK